MTQLSRRSRDHELRGSTSYSAWQRLALTRPSASRKTTLLRCGSRRSCRTTIRGSPRSSKIWVPLCAGTGPLITTARRYAPSEGAASSHLESGFGSLVQRVTRHMVRARVLEGILHPLWDLSRRVRRRNSHRLKTEIRAASGSALTGPRARRDRRGGRRPAGAQPWCSDAGGTGSRRRVTGRGAHRLRAARRRAAPLRRRLPVDRSACCAPPGGEPCGHAGGPRVSATRRKLVRLAGARDTVGSAEASDVR
jgi:hypothetical protein